MKTSTPEKIYLKDYQSPAFAIEQTQLSFDIQDDFTIVQTQLQFKKLKDQPLVLNGVELELMELLIDGKKWTNYSVKNEQLTIEQVPKEFILKSTVKIYPNKNTALEGLYLTPQCYLTQCEAEGFRRITYYLDRPDVMSSFKVRIEANKKKCPVLLSNGDLVESGNISTDRHFAVWHDPFKKPCYLFALVAGDLGVIRDQYITSSGKKVKLEIYAPHGLQNRCHFAMESLKKSMQWDESRFGREYDLSTYMIVATNDFNAGAMENKGLNIFNSRLVLADSKSATDEDYFNIESVVAHEYFHNWTGNRVTLRDWFHLSLKEGLTVFRDQEFSMDMGPRAVVRIDSVNNLRQSQFVEDSGPTAHPIRPESCYAVDNFFTSTIYEKGAEVIRMMQTKVGRPGFRKGMDLYFARHDGQAVIIEDFAQAISEANNQNWEQFKLWYSQAGTPKVHVTEHYENGTYTLNLEQSCPPTPDQLEKKNFDIPLVIGLLDQSGREIELNHPSLHINTEGQRIIPLTQKSMKIQFPSMKNRPILSLNRGFSAPIHLDWNASEADLIHLLSYDTDEYNRWEASQKLCLRNLQKLISQAKQAEPLQFNKSLLEAYRIVLQSSMGEAIKAALLELVDDSIILQHEKELDAKAFYRARMYLLQSIARELRPEFLSIYEKYHGKNTKDLSFPEMAKRRLKNLSLSYLYHTDDGAKLAKKQFDESTSMTDQQAALVILAQDETNEAKEALDSFYQQWKDDTLVLNKWFAIQSHAHNPHTFEKVKALCQHSQFDIKNPNRVYSLLRGFGNNLTQFHDEDQETYSFMADKIIELDRLNPQVATRVAASFQIFDKLKLKQKQKAHSALNHLINANLSKNTYEIVSKIVGAN